MPEYRENGLTVSWDSEQSPANVPGRLIVSGMPTHPSNMIQIIYKVDGGPDRVARGFPLDTVASAGPQRFAVDLPLLPAGSEIQWRPVLSCSGREADPGRGGIPSESFVTPTASKIDMMQASVKRNSTLFPWSLELLARVTAPLEHQPEVVGETPEGLRIVWPLGANGTVLGPRLNGRILHHGGDWMLIRKDGIGIPNVRVLVETERGDLIQGEYSGVVDFGPDGYQRLLRKRPPAHAYTQLVPKYVTSAKDLLWLNRLQCAAFGWVTMKTLLVEYDLYAMHRHGPER
jgi:hypothetical protein